MKFTIDAKKIKEMIEKGTTVINKRASMRELQELYFQVKENGVVSVLGTDLEHYIEITTDAAYDTKTGILGIEAEDAKIITKMKGEITIEDVITEENHKVNIKCGKKIVTIPGYTNKDIFLPSMDKTEVKILSVKENWLLDTITNLATFTGKNVIQKMYQVFNFNTNEQRVEALDGSRIGMRTLKNQKIFKTAYDIFDTVKLHNKCVPVFKKVMDKKSESEIMFYQNEKYVKIKGKDFTYISKRIEGTYFKIDQMISIPEEFRFIPEKKAFLEIMKYNVDLIKNTKELKNPVVLHSQNGTLYSYIKTGKYESFDKVGTNENAMENTYIGFNPQYFVDVFNIIDCDYPVCVGTNAVSPLMIYGNEYSFLILPIAFKRKEDDYKTAFNNFINKEGD